MTKITDLTATSIASDTDIIPMVEDPSGTAITKKVTKSDLIGLRNIAVGETITSTSLVDIQGLTVPLTAGTWSFEANISLQSSTTAGVKFGVQYSGTTTSVSALHIGQLATTTWGATARITALNTGSTTIATTANVNQLASIFGKIVVSTAGNLTIQGLKVTSGNLIIYAESFIKATRIA